MQRWMFFAVVLFLCAGQGVAAQDALVITPTQVSVIDAGPARDQLGLRPVAALSPDGAYLALANRELGSLDLWSTATGELLGRLPFNSRVLAFSRDGQRLAVIAPNILVFNVGVLAQAGELAEVTEEVALQMLESGLVHTVLPATHYEFGDDVPTLVFTPDGNSLMTVSVMPNMIWVYDVSEAVTVEELMNSQIPPERASVAVEPGDPIHIDALNVFTGSDHIYALSTEMQDDETAYFVRQIDADPLTGAVGGAMSEQVASYPERVFGTMSAQSHDVLIATQTEQLFFAAGGDPAAPVTLPWTNLGTVSLSPNGQIAAAVIANAPTSVEYADTATGEILASHPVTGRVARYGILFSDDGSTVAVVTSEGVEIWSIGAPSP